jgi:hypothetical protein
MVNTQIKLVFDITLLQYKPKETEVTPNYSNWVSYFTDTFHNIVYDTKNRYAKFFSFYKVLKT